MASILENCEGFDWDEGNSNKNWYLHRVNDKESEEFFSNLPVIVAEEKGQSSDERRNHALGRTDSGRCLFVAFTVRGSLVRGITSRDMNKREERRYEEEIKRNS